MRAAVEFAPLLLPLICFCTYADTQSEATLPHGQSCGPSGDPGHFEGCTDLAENLDSADDVTSLLALSRELAHNGKARASGSKSELLSGQKTAPGHIEFPSGTEVPNLPGFGSLADHSLRMSSGYVPVGDSKELFYVFVESQNDPLSDPFLLWTNGGPGCSGLLGFWTEMGPFRPIGPGQLTLNPHAWTKFANMVFIEQPAGVGFSTPFDSRMYNDTIAASDAWEFIKGFFALYPQLRALDFWLTSESYGGHYMPNFAREILRNSNGEVNFKGFVVGNPLVSMPFTQLGMYTQWNSWSLLAKPDWDVFVDRKCPLMWTKRMPFPTREERHVCMRIYKQFWHQASGVDPYALGFPVCSSQAWAIIRKSVPEAIEKLEEKRAEAYEPCLENYMTAYLNEPDVQDALHVKAPVNWKDCAAINYDWNSELDNMVGLYKELVEQSDLRIMIMSGVEDSVCATVGDQQWIWDTGYNISEPWGPYEHDHAFAGHTVKFTTGSSGRGFRYTTVHAAGHMIPTTQPERAYYIVKKFIDGDW